MKGLLIEDEKIVRDIFRRLVGNVFDTIIECDRLSDAMQAIDTYQPFDIIILDLVLKDADREQSVAAIPAMKKRVNAPIIVVTGHLDAKTEKDALEAGADAVLPKGDMFTKGQAMLIAIYAATIKHPRKDPDESYKKNAEMLKRLVGVE